MTLRKCVIGYAHLTKINIYVYAYSVIASNKQIYTYMCRLMWINWIYENYVPIQISVQPRKKSLQIAVLIPTQIIWIFVWQPQRKFDVVCHVSNRQQRVLKTMTHVISGGNGDTIVAIKTRIKMRDQGCELQLHRVWPLDLSCYLVHPALIEGHFH